MDIIEQQTKIYLDAACDILYSSFYIDGLYKIFGKKNVRFTNEYFTRFDQNDHFLALVLLKNDSIFKIVIDFTDADSISLKGYQWSDVYAKINVNFSDRDKYPKLLSIGPSFGVNIYTLKQTIFHSFINFYHARKRITNKKKFFSNYKAQWSRPRMAAYSNQHRTSDNYLFFVASLWKKENTTNELRKNFIEASKSLKAITFEGGFAPRTKNDIRGFESNTMTQRISIKEYLNNIKKSFAVFNTPAVLSCHGWKLAEYLALGKAIISTPISRDLPAELINNEHLLFTDGTFEDLKIKIQEVQSNNDLRDRLEQGAKSYYQNNLEAEKVIQTILNNL